MIKLVALLHEDTIINFKMMAQLCKRYKLHLLFAALFFLAFTFYSFYSKPLIYSVSVPMKASVVHQVSKDLSSLQPIENVGQVSLEELKITLSHNAFLKSVAAAVLSHPNFKEFNLGNLRTNKTINEKELLKMCGKSKLCMQEHIAAIVGSHFLIESGITDNRFMLTVNARDRATARMLTTIFSKAIEADRLRINQYLVVKEISSVENLLAESRSMIRSLGGNEALEEQNRLQNNIVDIKERIRMLQQSISSETIIETTLLAKLAENTKSIKSAVENGSRSDTKAAHTRLLEIKANLLALTQTPESQWSMNDKLIVSQLNNEIKELSNKFPSELKLKSIESKEVFNDKQREGTGSLKFDYQVALSKRLKLEAEYKTSNEELSLLMQKKLALESKVNGMQAEMNFIKSLEAKLMSLKLVSATLNPDLLIEDGNLQADEFRNSSPLIILLVSFIAALIVYSLSLVIRYAVDDRIYGEDDLKACFKDLNFVGDVPSFET